MKYDGNDYSKYVNSGWATNLLSLGVLPVFDRAAGDRLYDAEGNEWYDFINHYGVTLFGHDYQPFKEHIIHTLEQQLPTGTPMGVTTFAPRLAAMMIDRLALHGEWNNWTLTTGAEAVEAALKIAVSVTGKSRLLARKGSFHGLSALTVSLSDTMIWRSGYEVLTLSDSIDFFESTDEACSMISSGRYASVILEPLQAFAGGRSIPANEILKIRKICDAHSTVLVIDEVFTGMGRCGHYSAMQSLGWSIQPDAIIFAKTLTGGLLPSSQLVIRSELFSEFNSRPGCAKILASTFSGYPLGQSMAIRVIEELDHTLFNEEQDKTSNNIKEKVKSFATCWPKIISEVNSMYHLHFISFFSSEHAAIAWHYLFTNRVLVSICSHRHDTIKIITSLKQTNESLNALFDVLNYVCEEAFCD